MVQHLFLRVAVAKRNVLKLDPALGNSGIGGVSLVSYRRLGLKHFADTVRRNRSSRQHYGYHGQHKERHYYLHCIGQESYHVAHLHFAVVNSLCAEPYYKHAYTVHYKGHERHHDRHHAVGKKLGLHKIFIRGIEAFLLVFLAAERPDNRKSRKYLSCDKVEAVDKLLHDLEFRHCYRHKHRYQRKYSRNRNEDYPAHSRACANYLYNAADTHDRRVQNHAQYHNDDHLHLLYVVGGAGYQRGCGELIHFRIGKGNHPAEYLFADVHTEQRAKLRREKSDYYCNYHYQQGHSQHFGSRAENVAHSQRIHVGTLCFKLASGKAYRHLREHNVAVALELFVYFLDHRRPLFLRHCKQSVSKRHSLRKLHTLGQH